MLIMKSIIFLILVSLCALCATAGDKVTEQNYLREDHSIWAEYEDGMTRLSISSDFFEL
jgi:hypothetical protein